jgi:hypothetical protein
VPLGDGYRARSLTYTFVDGALARIAFRSSMDGFAYVTARLEARYQQPDRVARDTLKTVGGPGRPHVIMAWRRGTTTIRLDDPIPHTVDLRVEITQDDLAGRLPKPS